MSVLPTPMIMCCGIIEDVSKAVTADFKESDSRIYLIGETKDEMGGSLLYRVFGGRQGKVPGVNTKNVMDLTKKVLKAMDEGLVKSCHDCSDGGLAVAVAEMCISGKMGAVVDLRTLKDISLRKALYSESNTRWIAEVSEEDAGKFEEIMKGSAYHIGKTGGKSLNLRDSGAIIGLDELYEAWSTPIAKIMESSDSE